MPTIASRLLTSVCIASIVGVASLAMQGPIPGPPIKPGLWETRTSNVDANGQEVSSPEIAALGKMPPEMRARMAEAMRARGVQLPDENGVMKVCLSKETLDSGSWQQLSSGSGCVTTFSTRSSSTWRWHSTCASLHSESDGEIVFSGSESYRTKVTMTSTASDKTTTRTRVSQGTWISAACGDIKPVTAPPATAPGR
jgi:Protein of unknown function (DUF3617)